MRISHDLQVRCRTEPHRRRGSAGFVLANGAMAWNQYRRWGHTQEPHRARSGQPASWPCPVSRLVYSTQRPVRRRVLCLGPDGRQTQEPTRRRPVRRRLQAGPHALDLGIPSGVHRRRPGPALLMPFHCLAAADGSPPVTDANVPAILAPTSSTLEEFRKHGLRPHCHPGRYVGAELPQDGRLGNPVRVTEDPGADLPSTPSRARGHLPCSSLIPLLRSSRRPLSENLRKSWAIGLKCGMQFDWWSATGGVWSGPEEVTANSNTR